MTDVLLEVKDLKVHYPVSTGLSFWKEKEFVKAVDGVSFCINKGESLGLVGESGCGKTTIGQTIVKLNSPTEGSILYNGESIFETRKHPNLALKIQIIFQDPYSSLDPRFTVGRCIAEPLVIHRIGNDQTRRETVVRLMKDVGLNEGQISKFPHEFSGGQRQRIGVARALALQPSLIVCDEPVSALDVSIQAQILNLMQELQQKYHLTYLFISHNLAVVNHLCDRIIVMYLGNIMEISPKKSLFDRPLHPYTQALLNAIPIPDPDRRTFKAVIKGDVPSPRNPPAGCVFHTRCSLAQTICRETKPQMREIEQGHFAACHFA
jgi:oligopeptide/dipeptide ABC transporter ATP-binding protein